MNGTILLIFFNKVRLPSFNILVLDHFEVSWLDYLIIVTILANIVLVVHFLIEEVVVI
jgi:hypothetical protein